MIFSINNKSATDKDIQSLPLSIKYDINFLLRKKFEYKIKDIMLIFDRTRDTINKWLAKKDFLDDSIISLGSGITSRNKSFIHISIKEDKYHITYYVGYEHEDMTINMKNCLISGDTIESLLEKNFSKSTIGRLRKEVFTQESYDNYNTKIIKHINRYLLEYKPVILNSFKNKLFLWNENKLAKIIIILDKEGFSIPAINHIFSNISIHIKFPTVIQPKQEKQFDFIKYIWCSMTITRKKEIVDEITKIFNTTRKYTLEYIDLYSIFNEVLQSPYTVDKKIKKILFNVIDTKTYINTPISKTFNKKAIKDNEDDFLATTIYEFSYHTTKKSILDIFVNIVKSLYNILQFHLEYNQEEKNNKMDSISEFKIKKHIPELKKVQWSIISNKDKFQFSIHRHTRNKRKRRSRNSLENAAYNRSITFLPVKKKFNISYSHLYDSFTFKNKYDLDHNLSTTYSITREV